MGEVKNRRARQAPAWRSQGALGGNIPHHLVEIEGGPIQYQVIRSRRRRRTVEVAVHPEGVVVRAPQRMPLAEIHAFVARHARWISRRAAQLPFGGNHQLADGADLPFLGHTLTLAVAASPRGPARATLARGRLEVVVPAAGTADERALVVRKALVDWYVERAVERLPRRVEAWARRVGIERPTVLVRHQRHLWGSCSHNGTIRLNWRLVMVAPRLVDYVIVHELMHLRIRNHSPEFWAEVARVLPDHRLRRAELNRLGASLPI